MHSTIIFSVARDFSILNANTNANEIITLNKKTENNFKKICEFYLWFDFLTLIDDLFSGVCGLYENVIISNNQGSYNCKLYLIKKRKDEDEVLIIMEKSHKDLIRDLNNKLNNLQNVMDLVPHYLFWKDKKSMFLGCNEQFAKLAGLAHAQDIYGKNDFDLPWDRIESEGYISDDQAILKGEVPSLIREETLTIDGKKVDLLTTKVPLTDKKGRITGVIAIGTDITDRIIAAKELGLAKEKAELANEAKSNFLAVMSHELRTPLNGIIGLIQILEKHEHSAISKEYLKDIDNAAKHLLSLVNDILDFSKLELNTPTIQENEINIRQIFDEAYSTCKPRAIAKELDLHYHFDGNNVEFIMGDSLRLKQVMLNLIDNAIKYTNHGSIDVTLSIQNNLLHFSVKDTGIGISENDKGLVFEKFYQASSNALSNPGGVGLGLAICKKLVEQMHGEINCESALGEGSVFWFTVPCVVSKNQESKNQLNVPKLPEGFSADILIVEDNHLNQKVVKLLLEDLGCKVDIASSGGEAIKAVGDKNYDLIFLDVGLPDFDGYTVAKKIRKKFTDLKIIGLTAHADSKDIQRCLKSKMNDVITKPARISDFSRVLSMHIQK